LTFKTGAENEEYQPGERCGAKICCFVGQGMDLAAPGGIFGLILGQQVRSGPI
jgi:hypothetical protein